MEKTALMTLLLPVLLILHPSHALEDYAGFVDPWIESNKGRWFFSTPAAMPFGMVKLTPHGKNQDQYGGGYNYSVPTALGFCHLHGWMTTGLCVMPTTGGNFDVKLGDQGWKSNYSHATETVTPGYHKLHLDKYNLGVELTTSNRVGFHRYTFNQDGRADIIISLSAGKVGPAYTKNGSLTRKSPTEIEGYFDRTNGEWGGPTSIRTFFVMVLNKPVSRLTPYQDTFGTSGYLTFDTVSRGEVVLMKAGLSFTSIENARRNLQAEVDHWDFDRVKTASRNEWNRLLGNIKVTGGTPNQKKKFYTDLWHVLLGREMLEDVNGDYPDYTNGRGGNDNVLEIRKVPLAADGTPKFHIYNSDSFWLTQWNLNTLWGLAWPDILDDFANALLEMGKVGGSMDRGPNGGGYSYIMTGAPASMLVAAAYQKKAYTFDPMAAFAQIKKDQSPGGIQGIDAFYLQNGWLANQAGVTLEANFQDWCAAQMARDLGLQADYAEFMRRSRGWQKLYHPSKFIFPKRPDGSWVHTNPYSQEGYIEANAWQATWFTSHDVNALVKLMGGKDAYCHRLDSAFKLAAPQNFVYGYSSGAVSYANQPGCSNAHLFNYAGKPWLTQYWVRQVQEKAYGGVTPDLGYGGHDEDQGQMGGISALMAMGLFAVQGTCGSEPIYDITSPIFDTVRIALDDKFYPGKEFLIVTKNNSKSNMYIQSATLNGQVLENCWFYHAQFANGGTLELTLGPQPNLNWGVKIPPHSDSNPVSLRQIGKNALQAAPLQDASKTFRFFNVMGAQLPGNAHGARMKAIPIGSRPTRQEYP